MSLEKRIASVARTLFLPEFSFASNKFKVPEGGPNSRTMWFGSMIC